MWWAPKVPSTLGTITIFFLLIFLFASQSAVGEVLTIGPNKYQYVPGEKVILYVRVNQSDTETSQVVIEISNSTYHNILMIWTLNISGSAPVAITFRLPENLPCGNYSIYATCKFPNGTIIKIENASMFCVEEYEFDTITWLCGTIIIIVAFIITLFGARAMVKKEQNKGNVGTIEPLKDGVPKEDPRSLGPVVAFVGASKVGKTPLINAIVRYATRKRDLKDVTQDFLHRFSNTSETTGLDFTVLEIPPTHRLKKVIKKHNHLIFADGKGEYYSPEEITNAGRIPVGGKYILKDADAIVYVIKLGSIYILDDEKAAKEFQHEVEKQLKAIERLSQVYPAPAIFVLTNVDYAFHPKLRDNPSLAIDYVKRQVVSMLSRSGNWKTQFFVSDPQYLERVNTDPEESTETYESLEKKYSIPEIYEAILEMVAFSTHKKESQKWTKIFGMQGRAKCEGDTNHDEKI